MLSETVKKIISRKIYKKNNYYNRKLGKKEKRGYRDSLDPEIRHPNWDKNAPLFSRNTSALNMLVWAWDAREK